MDWPHAAQLRKKVAASATTMQMQKCLSRKKKVERVPDTVELCLTVFERELLFLLLLQFI